jgi:hypothetical protein
MPRGRRFQPLQRFFLLGEALGAAAGHAPDSRKTVETVESCASPSVTQLKLGVNEIPFGAAFDSIESIEEPITNLYPAVHQSLIA